LNIVIDLYYKRHFPIEADVPWSLAVRTSDVLKKLNIPRHKLYYLEQKGYIKPKRIPMGELEAREYSEEDFRRLELIWKYLQSGFKHKIAYQKAMEELQSPKLLDLERKS